MAASVVMTLSLSTTTANAGGGFLGIDSTVGGTANGVLGRRYQVLLQDVTPILVLGGALWEGDDSALGHTSWQAVDSLVAGAATASLMKLAFGRARPSQSSDPNQWFQGRGHNSFPSGEVMEITTAVTPFIRAYGADHPEVWALEILPLYDSIARVKSHAHWQSDVLASFAIGTGIGWYMQSRPLSISVGLLPRGITVGWKQAF